MDGEEHEVRRGLARHDHHRRARREVRAQVRGPQVSRDEDGRRGRDQPASVGERLQRPRGLRRLLPARGPRARARCRREDRGRLDQGPARTGDARARARGARSHARRPDPQPRVAVDRGHDPRWNRRRGRPRRRSERSDPASAAARPARGVRDPRVGRQRRSEIGNAIDVLVTDPAGTRHVKHYRSTSTARSARWRR